jgi:ParB family chromosome partitioning protein
MEQLKIDPEFEALIRPLPDDQFKLLEENILADGCLDALRTWEGILIDGHHRFKICTGHGLPFKTVSIDLRDRRAVRLWMIKNQLGRRDLTDLERVELVRMYRAEKEAEAKERQATSTGGSNPQLVEIFPQAENTKTRDELGEMAGMSGRTFEKYEKVIDHGVPELVEMTRRGELSASTASVIAEMPEEKQKALVDKGKKEIVKAAQFEVERRSLKARMDDLKFTHVSNNSGNNEWYTPAQFIEAAREVMGTIDTDPASSEIANRTVGAAIFYTAETNGLEQEWNGNVWMNPPYAQPLISEFAEAVTAKYSSGEINQAIVLVNNATETAFFQRMMEEASAVCFPRSRIQFIDPDGNPSGAPLQGQAILYFGEDFIEFGRVFGQFGKVVWLCEFPG